MFPSMVVAMLVELAGGDSVTTGAQHNLRPIHRETARITPPSGTVVYMEGSSVASTTIRMSRSRPPCLDANAIYMSVGPLGAAVPDTVPTRSGYFSSGPSYRRLRVTISTSENLSSLTIDDIVTVRADSRTVRAEYGTSPFDPTQKDLWVALVGAPRVLGPDPTGPPIEWLSPTSFAWITRSDTLVYEQKADSIFKLTIRARVR